MKKYFSSVLVWIALLAMVRAAEPVVTNVWAVQKPGTKLVEISYDVIGGTPPIYVSLQVSSNGGTTFAVPATALSGDLGGGVLPGRNKHIVWNAGTDWSNQLSNTVKFRVQAEASLAFSLPDSSYTQSGYWVGTNYTVKSVFNRSGWNLGNYGNGWIQADLGSQKEIHTITFQTGQWPNGTTWHEAYVSDTPIGDNWVNLTAVASRSGWTEAGQPLSLSFPPAAGRFVLIVANSGPSWTDLGDVRINPATSSTESSTNIRVDTRTLSLEGLVIEGPATIAPHQKTQYTAMLTGVDVTPQCIWWMPKCSRIIDGWWARPSCSSQGILDPQSAQPGDTIDLSVSFREPGGGTRPLVKRVTVTSGSGLQFELDYNMDYVGPAGGQVDWKVSAGVSGTAANQAGVTFTWYLNNDVQGTGKTMEKTIRDFPTFKTLRVVASDGLGHSGEQSAKLFFGAPAPGEPGQRYQVWRKSGVSFLNPAGHPTEPDPAKKNNGVIVITHGLRSYPEDLWILKLAADIETKLAGPGQPNIVVFGWEEAASPGKLYATAPERLATVASEVGLPAASLRKVLLPGTATTDFLFDVLMIREVAKDKGRSSLAKWFHDQEQLGNLSKAAPIHLIGHSAGGFVMGECATELKRDGFNIRRVTMLDTPFAVKSHVEVGSPAVVERYVSSLFGRFSKVDLVRYNAGGGLIFSEKPDATVYHRLDVGGWGDRWSPTRAMDSHGYSHDWYDETVPSYGEQEGFQLSPFVNGAPSQSPPSGNPPSDPIPPDNGGPQKSPLPPTGLVGFTTFGGVTGSGTPFVLTENGNAGIVKAMTLPPDASGLTFQYQFTSPGDGDFLVVFFGDSPPLFVASPTGSNTGGTATAEVSLAPYAGQTGNLVIKLVALEAANAVVTVGNIQMTLDDDLDGDGILAAAEVAAGTDPRLADTDGDGIDDPTELNTTHTNPTLADTDGDGADDGSELVAGTDPLDGSSRFAVKSAVKVGVDFSITWASIAGKHYRIIRSADPSFAGFDVVASGIAASPPQQSYTDTGGATESRMFYRVELE